MHHRWLHNQFSPFSLFSIALWDLPNSRPVHSLLLSSNLFLCLPCLLPPFTVSCKMVLARPDEQETCPYHCRLRLFTMVRRSSCGPIACWILARTSSLVTWSLYEMCSILRQYLISVACILLCSTAVKVHDLLLQWGAADAEVKNTELKGSPFKAWSWSAKTHACYAFGQGFLPC